MNEVYLEGVIESAAKVMHHTADSHHLVCQLRVSHRNCQGQTKHELYTVNVWNHLAQWAEQSIQPNMPVLVKGYLTQRMIDGTAVTEVTASRFVIRQIKPPAAMTHLAPSGE